MCHSVRGRTHFFDVFLDFLHADFFAGEFRDLRPLDDFVFGRSSFVFQLDETTALRVALTDQLLGVRQGLLNEQLDERMRLVCDRIVVVRRMRDLQYTGRG